MQGSTEIGSARESIFRSIRTNLAASVAHDQREREVHHRSALPAQDLLPPVESQSLVDLFRQNLEAVDGRCVIAENDAGVVQGLTKILANLQATNLRARRIAISDSPEVALLMKSLPVEFDEVAVTPSASDVFGFDVGISRVQAGIAETGTLLLDSLRERHRLVSLVPPVHIAIIDASQIVLSLGEALKGLQQESQVSPIVTLVTGPSRTADIELTLAIGVHGPQELYVIVRAGR